MRKNRSGIIFCRDAQNQNIGESTKLKREHVVRTKLDIYVYIKSLFGVKKT